MASTYVNDLRLNEMATGDASGSWGTNTNTNLELIGEALGYGTEAITTNADTHTTTVADGATDPGRSMYIEYTGTLDSACTITIAPNTLSRMHFIENGTSGSQNIIISQGSGANVTIPPGDTKAVYLDGAGSGAAVLDAFASLNVVDLKVQDDLTVTDDLIVNGDIDLEGAIDVNGTANLDVVDIDGAVDMASTLAVAGVVTANAGVVVDNITIDGTQIDLSSGDLTLDVAGDIILDADGSEIIFADGGTSFGKVQNSSSNMIIESIVSDKDILFYGNDGGSSVLALTLDMSGSGAATFNSQVTIGGNLVHAGNLTIDAAGDITLDGDGADIKFSDGGTEFGRFSSTSSNLNIFSPVSDKDIVFKGNDGGATITALTLDMSAAGAATFNDKITAVGTSVFTNLDISGDVDVDGTLETDNLTVGGAQGTDGQVLTSTGSGVGWEDASGGVTFKAFGTSSLMVGDDATGTISAANYNTGLGVDVFAALTSGDNNTAVGFAALDANTTASNNTAVGYNSLGANTTGAFNTASGRQALLSNTTGDNNVAVGGNALYQNTTADDNTAVGAYALDANTTGGSNTAVGANALDANTTAANNTAVGKSALKATTTGAVNVAVGTNALLTNITGTRNSALGVGALQLNTASDNVGIGYHALDTCAGGSNNTAVGTEAMDANTSGSANVAVGYRALDANTTADNNVAIGQAALGANTTGSDNTAVGKNAGLSVTTGIQNTIVGTYAGDALTDADYNTAMGVYALGSDTLGSRNTAIGRSALSSQNFTSATDSNNTAVGFYAGLSVTTGTNNTFVGTLAGDATDDGHSNVAVGYEALSANCGYENTAVGNNALKAVTGIQNTAVGTLAGLNITSGGNNVFIGRDAGITGSPGGNTVTASNKLGLGDENISAAHIQVDWTVASDARDKTDFTALDLGLDFVKALAPVTYKWDKRAKYGDKYADDYDLNAQTPDGTHKEDWLDIGFKAQEVQALEEAAGYTAAAKKNLTVSTSEDNKQMGLQYSKFIPILVKAIQEQNALIEALTARVTTLEG